MLIIFESKQIKLDFERFPEIISRTKIEAERFHKKLLKIFNFVLRFVSNKEFSNRWNKISEIYYLLEDNYSKKRLIELMSARVLGFNNVKLSLNNDKYWKIRDNIKSLIKGDEIIQAAKWKLNFFDLSKIKIPIKLFSTSPGIMCNFLLEQYRYNKSENIVAKEREIIIDAGGCWGDIALYFANKVGKLGKVFSFEFISDNLNVFKKNIDLNPFFKEIITIVENPLGKNSDCELFIIENGPSSRITEQPFENFTKKVKSISTDEYVKQNGISKINFIKMDIEGSEFNALIGAKQTIIKYKPKLAIAIYHNQDQIFEIPQFLNSLNLNYKFYLDHFTTHGEESILFAKVD